MSKALILKETEKAACLSLVYEDILGDERKIPTWFPKTWLDETNNFPKNWALNKKMNEARQLHMEWSLILKRIEIVK